MISTRRPVWPDLLRVLGLLAVLGVAGLLVRQMDLEALLDADRLRAQVDLLGWKAPVLYLGAFVVTLGIAGQILLPTIAGGVLFGWLGGGLMAVLGATLASVLQFLVVRYGIRGPAERLLLARFPAVRAQVEERGLALLVLLRFIWFPAAPLTFATALTRMPLQRFLLGFPALLPQALVVCLVSDSVARFGWTGVPWTRWGAVGVLAAVSFGAYLGAVRRWPQLRALRKAAPSAP